MGEVASEVKAWAMIVAMGNKGKKDVDSRELRVEEEADGGTAEI